VIPKSSRVERIKENFECDSFVLSNEDREKIHGLNMGWRCVDPK